MSPIIISIPVTPLIFSLFNECKENLKYADKSNTDFLIFLLNSSMHIFSIVKEFSPILQDALDSNGTAESSTSQLQELEKKSIEFASPSKSSSTPHDKEEEYTGHCTSDDEISLDSLNSPSGSLTESPNSEAAISDHFANYSKPSKLSTPSKKNNFVCRTCSATFSFKQGLQRHISKKSCQYFFEKKKRLSMINSHSKSEAKAINGKSSPTITKPASQLLAECLESNDSDDDSVEITNALDSSNYLLCPDCGKGFETTSNLNRHVKLSRSCGRGGVDNFEIRIKKQLSISLPVKLSDDPPSLWECTFCGSVLSSEKTYNVHRRKFRCKRQCKFCDFSSSQSIFVQNHLTKEHGLLLSLDEIEDYNKKLFLEHFKSTRNSPTSRLSSESRCPIYKCEFSSAHKGGLTTHIRFHKAEIARDRKDISDCKTCGVVGIPDDEFDSHECNELARESEIEPATDEVPGVNTDETKDNSIGEMKELDDTEAKSPPKEMSSSTTSKSSPIKSPVSLKLKRKTPSTSSTVPSLLKIAKKSTVSSNGKTKSNLFLKNKISSKRVSLDSAKRYKCKFCSFVGASNKHVAGHMNMHKLKRPRLSDCSVAKSSSSTKQ